MGGADIGGCGLESCNARKKFDTIAACAKTCGQCRLQSLLLAGWQSRTRRKGMHTVPRCHSECKVLDQHSLQKTVTCCGACSDHSFDRGSSESEECQDRAKGVTD